MYCHRGEMTSLYEFPNFEKFNNKDEICPEAKCFTREIIIRMLRKVFRMIAHLPLVIAKV